MILKRTLLFCTILLTAQLAVAQAPPAASSTESGTELTAEQIEALNAARQEGNLLFSQRKFREAIEAFSRALAIDPALATTHFNVGVCHSRLREYEASLPALRRAVQIDPNFGEARLEIAKVLFLMRNLEESEQEYLAIRRDLADSATVIMTADNMLTGAIATGYRNRAARALNTRDYDQALADARHAVELNQAEPASYYYMAKAQQGLRDYDGARQSYDAVLERAQEPSFIAKAHTGLGLLDVREAREAVRARRAGAALTARRNAVRHLQAAVEADSTDDVAYLNLGNTLYDLERFSEAVSALTAAERYAPRSYKAPLKLADAYIRLENYSQAEQAARRAVALQPRNATAHAFLAEALENQGQLAEAIEEYNQARRDPRWRERALFKMEQLCQQVGNCARYGIDPNAH